MRNESSPRISIRSAISSKMRATSALVMRALYAGGWKAGRTTSAVHQPVDDQADECDQAAEAEFAAVAAGEGFGVGDAVFGGGEARAARAGGDSRAFDAGGHADAAFREVHAKGAEVDAFAEGPSHGFALVASLRRDDG